MIDIVRILGCMAIGVLISMAFEKWRKNEQSRNRNSRR